MPKIRVLIVDDAVVMRRLLTEALAADPDLEVVGSAANGRIALAKIPLLQPDLLVLDMEMPETEGRETLAALRSAHPHLPIVLFGPLAGPRLADRRDSLLLDGNQFIPRPEAEEEPAGAPAQVREQLVPRIKQLYDRATRGEQRSAAAPNRSPLEPIPAVARRVEVVAVGASTGGPDALAVLLSAFPAACPVPIVIVQHMPPIFTQRLAERLAALAAIDVREAVTGAPLEPAQVWLAPGDHHLVVARDAAGVRLRTHQGPPENSCRPSVDVLFRSVAQTYGAAALAVVLTGMGQDGLRGCACVREAGGQVLVQDEASSVVWGMPGFVARAGLADRVLPLDQLGVEIVRRLRWGRSLSVPPSPITRGKPCP
jgi:two-component system chemotaxis response regulator CheB